MKNVFFFVSLLTICLLYSITLADDNDSGVDIPANVPANSLLPSMGHPLCTAAINSDGTVAGGNRVNRNTTQTRKIVTGQYEIDFFHPCNNITAKLGFMRFIQVDTFQVGFHEPRICTTADRSLDASSVYVKCTDLSGADADASFFLMVTR